MYAQSRSVGEALFEKAHLKISRKLVTGFALMRVCILGLKIEIG
jgi:hypothetical protein